MGKMDSIVKFLVTVGTVSSALTATKAAADQLNAKRLTKKVAAVLNQKMPDASEEEIAYFLETDEQYSLLSPTVRYDLIYQVKKIRKKEAKDRDKLGV